MSKDLPVHLWGLVSGFFFIYAGVSMLLGNESNVIYACSIAIYAQGVRTILAAIREAKP
jgi:hypothetical protein